MQFYRTSATRGTDGNINAFSSSQTRDDFLGQVDVPLSHLPVRTAPDSGLHAGVGGFRDFHRVSVEYAGHDKGTETGSISSGHGSC